MSEVRSWSAPAPRVAGTDKLNSLIFIMSKTPLYLVMTDTASVPTLPSSLLSRFKMFGAAQPVWSVLQSDCVMADQPERFSVRVT